MNNIENGVKFLRKDPILKPLVEKYEKPNYSKKTNPFEALVSSIIYQQLATGAANTIYKRFKALYKNKNPKAEDILKTSDEKLRECGLSRQKISYLKDLSLYVVEKKIKIKSLDMLSDEEIIEELVKVRGIGKWTAQMFLIFNQGRLDVYPSGDLVIQIQTRNLYGLSENAKPRDLEKFAERWKPYRSLVAWYMWRNKDEA